MLQTYILTFERKTNSLDFTKKNSSAEEIVIANDEEEAKIKLIKKYQDYIIITNCLLR